jgi:hypothetical protein
MTKYHFIVTFDSNSIYGYMTSFAGSKLLAVFFFLVFLAVLSADKNQ